MWAAEALGPRMFTNQRTEHVRKKLWNLHWSYASHGKEETKQEGETKRERAGDECRWTGSDNIWKLSRLHGFLF